MSELGVVLPDTFKEDGFAIDHSYNKASVPSDVDAYIRLFLVKSTPNSSWGAYYEQKLKDLFIQRQRIGLRKETVAIRAKITGIAAPRKGRGKKRNFENVAGVVRKLIELRMTSPDNFSTDCETLAVFCGMADGEFSGLSATVHADGSASVTPHPKLKGL